MYRLIVRPQVRLDLIEIGDFIALDNPHRALSFINEIFEKLTDCAERPLIFPERSDLLTGLRTARHGRYLIFFLVNGSDVEIVRILHTARDLERAFHQ